MEIVKRELIRHTLILSEVIEIVYSNPIHIKGITAYKDKRKLWELTQRVRKKRQLLRRKDLQFLQKYLAKEVL